MCTRSIMRHFSKDFKVGHTHIDTQTSISSSLRHMELD